MPNVPDSTRQLDGPELAPSSCLPQLEKGVCKVGPAMYMYGVLAMVVVREAASQVLSPESRYQDANPVGLEDVEVDVQRAAIVRE